MFHVVEINDPVPVRRISGDAGSLEDDVGIVGAAREGLGSNCHLRNMLRAVSSGKQNLRSCEHYGRTD